MVWAPRPLITLYEQKVSSLVVEWPLDQARIIYLECTIEKMEAGETINFQVRVYSH